MRRPSPGEIASRMLEIDQRRRAALRQNDLDCARRLNDMLDRLSGNLSHIT